MLNVHHCNTCDIVSMADTIVPTTELNKTDALIIEKKMYLC